MGDFRKKISCRLISRGEKCSEKCTLTRISGVYRGKNLTPEVWGEFLYPNQITHTPLKSQMVDSFRFHAQEGPLAFP